MAEKTKGQVTHQDTPATAVQAAPQVQQTIQKAQGGRPKTAPWGK